MYLYLNEKGRKFNCLGFLNLSKFDVTSGNQTEQAAENYLLLFDNNVHKNSPYFKKSQPDLFLVV
jgi:hypothetical protein